MIEEERPCSQTFPKRAVRCTNINGGCNKVMMIDNYSELQNQFRRSLVW
jgi:hypothetical protein